MKNSKIFEFFFWCWFWLLAVIIVPGSSQQVPHCTSSIFKANGIYWCYIEYSKLITLIPTRFEGYYIDRRYEDYERVARTFEVCQSGNNRCRLGECEYDETAGREICRCNKINGFNYIYNDRGCERIGEKGYTLKRRVGFHEYICKNGYKEDNGLCQPICRDECQSGICVGPDKCECNPGDKLSSTNKHICVPCRSKDCKDE